jgi:hypothetical protein
MVLSTAVVMHGCRTIPHFVRDDMVVGVDELLAKIPTLTSTHPSKIGLSGAPNVPLGWGTLCLVVQAKVKIRNPKMQIPGRCAPRNVK